MAGADAGFCLTQHGSCRTLNGFDGWSESRRKSVYAVAKLKRPEMIEQGGAHLWQKTSS